MSHDLNVIYQTNVVRSPHYRYSVQLKTPEEKPRSGCRRNDKAWQRNGKKTWKEKRIQPMRRESLVCIWQHLNLNLLKAQEVAFASFHLSYRAKEPDDCSKAKRRVSRSLCLLLDMRGTSPIPLIVIPLISAVVRRIWAKSESFAMIVSFLSCRITDAGFAAC